VTQLSKNGTRTSNVIGRRRMDILFRFISVMIVRKEQLDMLKLA
jgi:hypothetical protein